ncbi:MAG: glycosyltransferase family 2 protein [Candidatus Omnitrophica bacterium]|nr:glycosyltransferase family 2 protein [Candidatus Omnitrophota bacterium]
MDEGDIPEMNEPVDISIIIPCLNEEQNIPQLVHKLDTLIRHHNLKVEVLVVDDCSDDYTFREAFILQKDFPFLRALHKGLPRGIGSAIRYGIDHAQGRMGVVIMGDLVDPLGAIVEFQNKIIKEGYHLSLLSRYLAPEDHKNIPLSYKFYQWWYRFLCRFLIGIQVKDITYAFRAFNLDWVRSLNLESSGFEISPEITIKTHLRGGRICEIKGRQGRRMQGESKFLFSKEGFGYARVLLKGIFMRRRF